MLFEQNGSNTSQPDKGKRWKFSKNFRHMLLYKSEEATERLQLFFTLIVGGFAYTLWSLLYQTFPIGIVYPTFESIWVTLACWLGALLIAFSSDIHRSRIFYLAPITIVMAHHFSLLLRNEFSPLIIITLFVGMTIIPAPLNKRSHVIYYFLVCLLGTLITGFMVWSAKTWYLVGALLFVVTNVAATVFYNFITKSRLRAQIEKSYSELAHTMKLASLGEMSAGIAHEINNPLAIIVGSAGLLRKFKNDPDKLESKIDMIMNSSTRIEKIVRGLKKFSRTSDGDLRQLTPLAQIIEEAVSLTETKAKAFGVKVIVEINNNLQIHCDPMEIEQVIINLLNNSYDAIKTLPEKWVRIQGYDTDSETVLQIIDSGNGISPEIVKKLFQPFFTTKPVGEGTGLGLSISKGILDQHQARFFVNREFKNTCFEIRFAQPILAATTSREITYGH
jgi:signal transduction histidine kinase